MGAWGQEAQQWQHQPASAVPLAFAPSIGAPVTSAGIAVRTDFPYFPPPSGSPLRFAAACGSELGLWPKCHGQTMPSRVSRSAWTLTHALLPSERKPRYCSATKFATLLSVGRSRLF